MKKILSIVLVIVLLLCTVPTAFAAGSARLDGPSVVRAGDTITLTFYAGGGILGGTGTMSYDPAVLTLKGYQKLLDNNWEFESAQNFVFNINKATASPIVGSSAIFQATFTVNANVAVGTPITVSALNVNLSDGHQDMPIGTVTYSTTVAKPLSNNCNLGSMTVSGATISPAFSPEITKYSAKVPFSVSSIKVSATAEDDGAKVSIYNPTLAPGGTTTVQVTVTAENGVKQVYNIAVTREQDPNYIPSSNTNLKKLEVKGQALSPVFDKTVDQYYIWLPYEVDKIDLTATTEDTKASCKIGDTTQLPAGEKTDIPVTVTAEDGTQKVYTVSVVRAPAHDQVEAYLNGLLADPQPEIPPEVKPDVQPEVTEPTVPAPTEPSEPSIPTEDHNTTKLLLMGGLGFVAGAGIMALILLLTRKRKSEY